MSFTRTLFSAAIFGSLLLAAGCNRGATGKTKSRKKPPLVMIKPVKLGPIAKTLELTGEVATVDRVRIAALMEGPISFCPWREGDRVKSGEKLIEIDRQTYRAEVSVAEAALALARAKLADMKAGTRPEELDKAREALREAEQTAEYEKADFARIQQLVKAGTLPGDELEKAKVKLTGAQARKESARRQLDMLKAGYTTTAIAVQKAAVQEAESRLALARARLSECRIAAPFDSVVTAVWVRRGDMAVAKTPLLELVNPATQVLRCAVPEAQANEVREGMAAELRMDAIPGKVFNAKVTRVYPQLDPRLRTRTVELGAPQIAAWAPNMFGRVRLILASFADAVAVPTQAVLSTPKGGTVVFVVADGKAVKRKVRTGLESNGRLQIVQGLAPGDLLIVAGMEKLKDGVVVRMPKPKMKNQGGNDKVKTGHAKDGRK